MSAFSRVGRFDSAESNLRPLVTVPFSATIARLVSPSNSRALSMLLLSLVYTWYGLDLEEIKELAMKDMNSVFVLNFC
ncbi:hypothetical protein TorRG33x02_071210 [Trema orientale]|uniref:Uncharacterized protein n=1 Tax=Trema orientale TaxID=63057 RepID=A0A2P5FH08_TREOI|nr:hypothetical protein TorRG33x02_071210 [Trema orientale]